LFVSRQDNLDALPEHKVKALAEETETLAERNKALAAEVKAASAGVCLCLALALFEATRGGYAWRVLSTNELSRSHG